MMREPRNPFQLRSAEHISSDATYLRTFSPKVLDLLPSEPFASRVHVFRSSPGGGKTSLLRLFTPSTLLELQRTRDSDELRDLYQKLRALGVFADTGPELLGVLLSFKSTYSSLHDLMVEPPRKLGLLYALLNSRLLISALRSILTLARMNDNSALSKITLDCPKEANLPDDLTFPITGKDLYDWARDTERNTCLMIDSFQPETNSDVRGQESLFSISLLRPESILVNGKPLTQQTLILFDDLHKLTPEQRRHFLGLLFESRFPLPIWIAERLEALSLEEFWPTGAVTGREFSQPIHLEHFWGKNQKNFEHALSNIADRRARMAPEVSLSLSFAGSLDTEISSEYIPRLKDAQDKIVNRIHNRIRNVHRYDEWIKAVEVNSGNSWESALEWRLLEIIIERDIERSQLAFDFTLPAEDLQERSDSGIKVAAEFLLCQEFRFPYYYGFNRLSSISSANIEQFLDFSGEVFEELLSLNLLHRQILAEPERQEQILKRVAKRRWEEITSRVENGREVQKLLEGIRRIAVQETMRPSAPYAPGVTGIGIPMSEVRHLLQGSSFRRLHLAIQSSVTQNWLTAELDYKQGKKGQTWMILNLNRWLCVHFSLPLHYGGWRPRRLRDLVALVEGKSEGNLFTL